MRKPDRSDPLSPPSRGSWPPTSTGCALRGRGVPGADRYAPPAKHPLAGRKTAEWVERQDADDALRELGFDDAELARVSADGVVYDQRCATEGDG